MLFYRLQRSLILLVILTSLTGCVLFRKTAMSYVEVKLPVTQIVKDVPYWDDKEADPLKNRLDLFLPAEKNFPTMIFVHGGTWTSGDKDMKYLGADIYSNIGRYYASQGIGVAVISYRLMPGVDWKSQTMDVARATSWVYHHIQEHGGNPKNIFLSGHSAGAQLVTRIAVEPRWLESLGLSTKIISGVIAVSGAGYDLTDEATYELAQKQDVFEDLFFTGSISNKLRRSLSPIKSASAGDPPFLIFYGESDKQELQDESRKLYDRLYAVGDKAQLIGVPSEGHKTIVTALSNPVKVTTASIRVFIQTLVFF